MPVIPVRQACVKLTNEPPEGMKVSHKALPLPCAFTGILAKTAPFRAVRQQQANLKRSINYFNDDMLEECSKQAEFKNITFALAFFHAVGALLRHCLSVVLPLSF
eukprot:SAG22_NODE_4356_length_1293_cov_2.071189_3_plen_105_part_00